MISRGGSRIANPLSAKAAKNTVAAKAVEKRTEAVTQQVDLGATQVIFTVYGAPVPKPRQTRSDRWKKRPCVARYREWADHVRDVATTTGIPLQPIKLAIVAYMPIPKSWNRYKRETLAGKPHRQSPDIDNLIKAQADALYPKGDEMINEMRGRKFWDDGNGPRVEFYIS